MIARLKKFEANVVAIPFILELRSEIATVTLGQKAANVSDGFVRVAFDTVDALFWRTELEKDRRHSRAG